MYETNHVGLFRHHWAGLPLNNSSVMNKFDELLTSLYPSDTRVLSNHIFVAIHQVTICCEVHKLNVVLKFFALVFNTTVCIKQTMSARLGTTGLPLNNSSVINKFNELLIHCILLMLEYCQIIFRQEYSE